MRKVPLLLVLVALALACCVSLDTASAEDESWSAAGLDTARGAPFFSAVDADVVLEINKVRSDPARFSDLYIAPMIGRFSGKGIDRGGVTLMTQEGAAAVRECVEALHRAAPRGTLKPLAALARAAKDQVRLQGPKGQTGHSGPDGSTPESRVRRYDPGRRFLGENIDYGSARAREIVIDLLVDDGVPGRGHRENLLRKDFSTVGVAVGPHAKYGAMCVIDLSN
ncbi:MAG TPA: CAP domain-containing protein [Spirochaetia bacterium]|nr:CAP domain-containing protein [Spirochaetia bacterium]